ncbi:hypothetical protein NKR19_g6538 [Coniochaeta hoffmannii]|uniref:Uncharacterized protein n=1 Tax=Coniochaeta hoffmannii TaxID=91930 RepID=A0AA38VEI9_9PEZI|nr:hypothetical protein NKR19_g6538 [Coniochaeta hoffmannii]
MSDPSAGTMTGDINNMPPSAALKLLGFWDMHRRQRLQVFVTSIAPICSGNDDLQNRVLAFVAGDPDSITAHYPDIVLFAAARKLVAVMDLNLNLTTITADASDDTWLNSMKMSPNQLSSDLANPLDFVPATAGDVELFAADEPTDLALSPVADAFDLGNAAYMPAPGMTVADGLFPSAGQPIDDLAFPADWSRVPEEEWLFQQPAGDASMDMGNPLGVPGSRL